MSQQIINAILHSNSNITVDASECGSGKTRDVIFPLIKYYLKSNERVIVVVPSILLQEVYQTKFKNASVVNSSGHRIDSVSVYDKILKAIVSYEKLIIITSVAFLELTTDEIADIKTKFNLIIDEAIDPTHRKHFFIGDVNQLTQCNIISNESILTRKESSTKYGVRIDFLLVHPIELLNGWKSLHIASAKFMSTAMGHWMRLNNVNYEIVSGYNKSDRNIVLHVANIPTNSITRQENSPELYKEGRRQLPKRKNIVGWLNGDKDIRSKYFDKCKMNAAGLSDYRFYTNAYIEAAINLSSGAAHFFSNNWNMSDNDMTDAMSTNLFYQLIMRTNMRERDSDKAVHVWMYSMKDAVILQRDYFSNCTIELFDVGYVKSVPKTNAENCRNSRARKKLNKGEI